MSRVGAVIATWAIALATVASAGAQEPASNPAPPVAVTGTASGTMQTSTTLTGTVTPGAAVTNVHFDLGTTTSYGLASATISVPAGAAATPVQVAVAGLTAQTTYHYRLSAANAAGTVLGADRTFSTAAPPRAPYAQTRSVVSITPSGATLVARINPRGQDTRVHFDYGVTSRYGAQTSEVAVPAGSATISVSVPLDGLAANTSYSYRAVVTNATGAAYGNRHTFRTTRGVSGVTLKAAKRHVAWGAVAAFGGQVSGASVGGAPVTLWRRDHPFTGDYRIVSSTKATTAGTFGFTTPALYWATRFKVTVDTPAGASSSSVTTIGDLYTKLRITARQRREVQLRGLVYPGIERGTVTIQRRTPGGRWITARRTELSRIATGNRSGFRAWVPRLSTRSARYRAVVTPDDAGAHARTSTKTVLAPRRR